MIVTAYSFGDRELEKSLHSCHLQSMKILQNYHSVTGTEFRGTDAKEPLHQLLGGREGFLQEAAFEDQHRNTCLGFLWP